MILEHERSAFYSISLKVSQDDHLESFYDYFRKMIELPEQERLKITSIWCCNFDAPKSFDQSIRIKNPSFLYKYVTKNVVIAPYFPQLWCLHNYENFKIALKDNSFNVNYQRNLEFEYTVPTLKYSAPCSVEKFKISQPNFIRK